MRYDKETRAIVIAAPELVRLARIRRRTRPLSDDAATDGVEKRGAESISDLYERGGRRYRVTGEVTFDGDDVVLLVPVPENAGEPDPDLVRQTRGEGFCLLAMLRRAGRSRGAFRAVYLFPSGETIEKRETPTAHDLERFYDRLFEAVERDAAAEIERVERRLPSMAKAV